MFNKQNNFRQQRPSPSILPQTQKPGTQPGFSVSCYTRARYSTNHIPRKSLQLQSHPLNFSTSAIISEGCQCCANESVRSQKSQYSMSTIISETGLTSLLNSFSFVVAILNEYDYIRKAPLESLAWQGLPAQKPEQKQNSAMPRDNTPLFFSALICILSKYQHLYNNLS